MTTRSPGREFPADGPDRGRERTTEGAVHGSVTDPSEEELIVWLPPGREQDALDLPLLPPRRGWRTRRGLFLHGRVPAGRSYPGHWPTSAHRFRADDTRPTIWRDATRTVSPAPATRSAPEGHLRLLVPSLGPVDLPLPETWPRLAESIRWEIAPPPSGASAREDAGPAVPSWRIRLRPQPPPTSRDGLLLSPAGHEPLGTWLAARQEDELRDLRLAEGPGWRCLMAHRGIAEDAPSEGRALVNLGTGVEPLLVPADRAPRPALSPHELRRLIGAHEGEGILWWDAEGKDRVVVFLRSRLERLTSTGVLSRSW